MSEKILILRLVNNIVSTYVRWVIIDATGSLFCDTSPTPMPI